MVSRFICPVKCKCTRQIDSWLICSIQPTTMVVTGLYVPSQPWQLCQGFVHLANHDSCIRILCWLIFSTQPTMMAGSGLHADCFKHPASHDGCVKALCTQPTLTVVSGLRAGWFKHPATHDGCIRASCTQPTLTVVSGLRADWFLAPSQPWWLYEGFMLRVSLETLWMYILMTVADGVKVYYW